MRMMEIQILGVTLSAALLNPKIARKYEDQIKASSEIFQEALKCEIGSEGIRIQCEAVIDAIDNIFGCGSARKVLGDETDLLTCLEAWKELVSLYDKQVVSAIRNVSNMALAEIKEGQGDT